MFSRELGLDALADLRELDHRHPDRVAGDVAEVVAALREALRDRAVDVVRGRARAATRVFAASKYSSYASSMRRDLGARRAERARDLDPVAAGAGDLE